MTAGACLPGSYTLIYSIPGGMQRATLTVKVERLTLTSFTYTFRVSNSSNPTEASALVSALLRGDNNATAALMQLAQEHLPSFGVDLESIRAVHLEAASVQPLLPTAVNQTVAYAINVRYTATLGSTAPVSMPPDSTTDPSSPLGRRLSGHELGVDSSNVGGIGGIAEFSVSLAAGKQGIQQQADDERRRALLTQAIAISAGLRRQAHHPAADGRRTRVAAGPGDASAPETRGDPATGQPHRSLHSLDLERDAVTAAAATTASDGLPRQAAPSTGPEAVALLAMQDMPATLLAAAARPFLTLAETLVVLLGGRCESQGLSGENGSGAAGAAICREREEGIDDAGGSMRRALRSTTSDCGSPGFTAPAAGGAIVSSSDPTSSCDAWAVSAEDVLMAEISGAIIGTEEATAAVLVRFSFGFARTTTCKCMPASR